MPPDPRAFEKPRRACTPQSNSRPLPATPPERPAEAPTPTEPKPDNRVLADSRFIPDRQDRPIPDRQERTVPALPDSRIERPVPNPPETRERLPVPDTRQIDQRQDRNVPIPDNRREERHVPVPDNRQERYMERPERHQENRLADWHVPERQDRHVLTDNRQERHLPESRLDNRHIIMPVDSQKLDRHGLDRHTDFRLPPERPPEKPDFRVQIESRNSFDRETRVESRAPPRQRSLPASTSGSVDQPTKSTTMPKFPSEDAKDPPYENVAVEKNELAVLRKLFIF